MSSYCEASVSNSFHLTHHNTAHGFPERNEARLFERLCMEIFQAGLSWLLILKRQDGLHAAFNGYNVDTIASYTDEDCMRLLNDERIIRNRLKVEAIVHNARIVQNMRLSHGGFAKWLDAHHPRTKPDWVKLFKKTFKFTGGEITGEFLMSTGYLPGAHHKDCPIYAEIAALAPPWTQVSTDWTW